MKSIYPKGVGDTSASTFSENEKHGGENVDDNRWKKVGQYVSP